MSNLSYALITTALNEEKYIEETIKSVVNQSILPEKWIIIDDGSTDGTYRIIKKYSEQCDWIDIKRMPKNNRHNYAAKAYNVNMAYKKLKDIYGQYFE